MKHAEQLHLSNVHETTVDGKSWPQYLAVLTALFSSFIAGIHYGWPSPSLPKLLAGEAPYNVTREEASYITIIGPIGDVVGSIIFPALVDAIGRKPTILLIAVPQITSLSLIYFSYYSKVLLYIARFMGGLSEAACFTILPIYIAEVADPKVRGVLGSFLTILIMTGVLVINLVGSYFTVYTTSLVFLSLPFLFLICFSYMPESPYYLLMKKRSDKASKALQWLRQKNDVDNELNDITQAIKRQLSEKGRFKDLWTIKSNRKGCMIIAGIRATQQLSGLTAMMMYLQVLFSRVSVIPKHLSSSLVIFLEILAIIAATFVIDKAGRKPLLIFSTSSCFVVLLLQAIFFVLQDVDIVGRNYNYIPIIGITLFMVMWSLGLGSIVNVMVGEVFSASVKAKAMCLLNIWFAILMSLTTKLFQFTFDNLGTSVPFFIFAFSELIGIVFIWKYVPETKNKTLEEIQLEFKSGKTISRDNKDCDKSLL